jgi:hypothetical protein
MATLFRRSRSRIALPKSAARAIACRVRLDPFKEVGHRKIQGFGDGNEHGQRRIGITSLDVLNVLAIDTGFGGQALLGQIKGLS